MTLDLSRGRSPQVIALIGLAIIVGSVWWLIDLHSAVSRQTAANQERAERNLRNAIAWLRTSDAKFQRVFGGTERALTTEEIRMLDAEITQGEHQRQMIEQTGDQAVIGEFDQYLTTMRRMAEGSASR